MGFYAVCIGSIPVGIIGSGYVEELENQKEEDRRCSALTPYTSKRLVLTSAARHRLEAGPPNPGDVREKVDSLRELLSDLSSPAVLRSMHMSELETYHRLLKQSIGNVDDFMFQEALAHRPSFGPSSHSASGIQ